MAKKTPNNLAEEIPTRATSQTGETISTENSPGQYGFIRKGSELYSLKNLMHYEEGVTGGGIHNIGRDARDFLKTIEERMNGTEGDAENIYTYTQAFLILKEISNGSEVKLPAEKKMAIQKLFGLSEEVKYEEKTLCKHIKLIAISEMGINTKKKYTFQELTEFAQFADQFYELNVGGEIFFEFSEQEIQKIFEHESPQFSGETVFEFAIMTPSERRGYLATRLTPKKSEIEKIKYLLGIREDQVFSIEDLKTYADKFDNKGYSASGLISLGTIIASDRNIIYEKKHDFNALIKFLLMDPDTRFRWIVLQK